MSAGTKKAYNNTFQTVIAIWDVLMEYSSKENPLTVKQIVDILDKNKDSECVPSANSVRRYLSGEKAVFQTISPTHILREKDKPTATDAYAFDNRLHVVLEDRAGLQEWSGDVSAVFELAPSVPARYSTIANLLGSYPEEEMGRDAAALPPVHLKCLVVHSTGKNGKKKFIPYRTWLDSFDNDDDIPKNKTRYYYLESVLSKAEWKMLADAVKVYPYITERQTKALLSRLKKLNPGEKGALYAWDQSYYAYKRSRNDKFFDIIDKTETAIAEQRAVSITYGSYVLERQDSGEWEPVLEKRDNKHDPKFGLWRIEPYDLMWSNGYYYLVGKNTGYGMMNLRVDRIIDLAVLQGDAAHFEKDKSFNPYQYRDKSPVMYPGTPEEVRLRCKVGMVNVLLDFFGTQARFGEPENGYTEVYLYIALAGVKLFAMQYADSVEVLRPQKLRDEVRDALKAALEAYQ